MALAPQQPKPSYGYNLFNLPENAMKFSSQLGQLGNQLYMMDLQRSDPELYKTLAEQQLQEQQMMQNQQAQQQEFGLRKDELDIRKQERAEQIARVRRAEAQKAEQQRILGGLAQQYSERTGLPLEQVTGLIQSGAIDAGNVLGSLQVDPMQQISLENARLQNRALLKELNKPEPKGIYDLLQQDQGALGNIQQPQSQQPEYREVQGDGFTQYVQEEQPLPIFNKAQQAESEKAQLDQLYDRALLTPNFDKSQLSNLESLRNRAAEQAEIAKSEVKNYETLLSSKQEIEEKLLQDIAAAKEIASGSKGSWLNPTDYLPGSKIGGFEGAVKSFVPGSDASNLSSALNRVKSSNVLGVLSKAKSESSSGATGFGALSEKELKVIADKIANLEVGQREEDLLRNINDVERDLKRQLEKINTELTGMGYQPAAQEPITQNGFSIRRVR